MPVLLAAAAPAAAGAPAVAARPSDAPACIHEIQTTESGRRPALDPVRLEPASGGPGTAVSLSADGFTPGARIVFVGLYAEDDCAIVGLGDQYLGEARADRAGSAAVTVAWPAMFDPVAGRAGFDPTPLPDGRYYVIATACGAGDDCSYTDGTVAGEPFVLGDADARGGLPLVFALGSVVALGMVLALVARRR